jgi:hypothetical protein
MFSAAQYCALVLNRDETENIGIDDKAVSETYFNT